jgi:hypothetical protein
VDAICINQEDDREKSQQIPRMNQVYEMAATVTVWLGEPDDSSNEAMDLVRQLNVSETDFFEKINGTWRCKRSKITSRKWASLFRFLQRPYFSRMWIIQELAFASVPVVFCGSKFATWEQLDYAALLLTDHLQDISRMCREFGEPIDETTTASGERLEGGCPNCLQRRRPMRDVRLVNRLSQQRRMQIEQQSGDLLSLCLINRDSDCFDPRDKIYALWKLTRQAEKLDMRPDYSLSISQTYLRFAVAYIRLTSSLDIICTPKHHCGAPFTDGDSLPSWCPDWRHTSPSNAYIRPTQIPLSTDELDTLSQPIFKASLDTKSDVQFSENSKTLSCTGVVLDVIAHVFKEAEDPVMWLEYANDLCHRNGEALSREEVRRQFWSMTLGDPSCSFTSDELGKRVQCISPLPPGSAFFKTTRRYPGEVMQSDMGGRNFIVTEQGYMGLAPFDAECGDVLAVLFGCSVPAVLTPREDHFSLRGDCFIQGW